MAKMRRKQAVQYDCDCSYAWGCQSAPWSYLSWEQYLPALAAPGSLIRDHGFPLITLSETQSPGSSFLKKTSLTRVSKTSCVLHYLHLFQTISPSSPCFLLSLFSCLHSLLNSPKVQHRHLFKNSLYLVKSYVHLILRECVIFYDPLL